MTTDRVVLILTTAPSEEVAERLARTLLERGLIACATITRSVRSLYLWKGAVHDDEEHALTLKTRAELAPDVEAALLDLHPYETPEVLVIPVSAGSAAYVDWLTASCHASPSGRIA